MGDEVEVGRREEREEGGGLRDCGVEGLEEEGEEGREGDGDGELEGGEA